LHVTHVPLLIRHLSFVTPVPFLCSPIRHITMFEDFNMMVLADTGGWLTVTDVPTPAELARLAATKQPSVIPGAPTPSRWSPSVARIKAHKGGIVAADSLVRNSTC
jgi:hypothetical protein